VASGSFRFEDFALDPADRTLFRGGAPVELNGRYFDALTLLVSVPGRLVPKDRFFDEVWRGIPVTDEALTQCIRTLRKQLGDDASRPRFIETVPKHGYRFIAAVERVEAAAPARPAAAPNASRSGERVLDGALGTAGGACAGLLGGLFYGFAASASDIGSASALLTLVVLTTLVATVGASAVSFGVALAGRTRPLAILGGAAGGLLVGAIVKLIATDGFRLLVGQAPGDITGAAEGALLGGAVGLGAWLASRTSGASWRQHGVAVSALCGGGAGLLIALAGGRLMGGSLEVLARTFPESRLELDELGALFGETGFGPLSQVATAGFEGALFGGCIAAGMIIGRDFLGRRGSDERA